MPILIHKEENKVDDDKARTTTKQDLIDLQMPQVDDDDDDSNDPQHQIWEEKIMVMIQPNEEEEKLDIV